MSLDAILQVSQLKKDFMKDGNRVSVLKGVDFTLKKGEAVAIVGASGAGKSTFLHIAGTLEPPTSGRVLFGDREVDVFKMSDRQLSQFRNLQMGFVFQFHYLLPEFSALENVMMPVRIRGGSVKEARKSAEALLNFVGLHSRMSHRPAELSGGEQQRVAIARAVVLKPRILFADEPTGNLDSENSARMVELLLQLRQHTGLSLLLVTHDQNIASKMDRVIRMQDGRIPN